MCLLMQTKNNHLYRFDKGIYDIYYSLLRMKCKESLFSCKKKNKYFLITKENYNGELSLTEEELNDFVFAQIFFIDDSKFFLIKWKHYYTLKKIKIN